MTHPCRSGPCARPLETRCTVEVSVARYYDPQTAQFLTRDPIEPITQQPYQYANDDPLDQVDPLGLCGWTDPFDCNPLGRVANAASKVGGAVSGAASSTVRAVGDAAGWTYRHAVFSYGVCVAFCVNVSFQGGDVGLKVGWFGLAERGPAVGVASKTAECRSQDNIGGGAIAGVGGAVEFGYDPRTQAVDTSDVEVDASAGAGGFVGPMYNVVNFHIPGLPR